MTIDSNILQLCRNNNQKGMEHMYQLLFPYLVKVAMGFVCNEVDARSIYNNGMCKIFFQIRSFKGEDHQFVAWCRKIIVNESLDFIKSSLVKRSFENIETTIDIPVNNSEIFDFENDNYIFTALGKLPETSRSVFTLFALEAYSHQEISQLLNISVANSKWHLFNARTRLKELLFNIEKLKKS
jgi:RNA polymerase sigma-70 factor (ECF subfamily)